MKTLFVVSDVHSYYDEMIKALNEQGFDKENKDHIFVSCGDLLDRGPDPEKCLNFVNNLERKILILGNHEELLLEAIRRGSFYSHDYHNCTTDTVYKLTHINPDSETTRQSYISINYSALTEMKYNKLWNTYISSCINYYETNKYIFVHGYIPIKRYGLYSTESYDKNWRSEFANWSEARWLNGMKVWNRGIREPNKTIVCGHWHSSYGHSVLHGEGVEFAETDAGIESIHTPFYDDGIIAIDACTAYSGFVNCIKLEVEDE